MGNFIDVNGVWKKFQTRSGEHVTALADISCQVQEGEFVCVVGPSGCGKSTLLRIIAGLVPPTQGQTVIAGTPVRSPRREIGMVFQSPVLLAWRSVIDNILVPAEVIGLPSGQARRRAVELLELVGLAQFADKFPSELSGGMRQRVAIARALMHSPQILLMDEPFGALDAMTRESMNIELLRIWEAQRKTVVLVTHSIEEAIFLADRIFVVSPRPGRLSDVLDVKVSRPRSNRSRYEPAFIELAASLRGYFENMHSERMQ